MAHDLPPDRGVSIEQPCHDSRLARHVSLLFHLELAAASHRIRTNVGTGPYRQADVHRKPPGISRQGASQKIEHKPDTVSYTHLRAHETPEHLVCRLLLAKKKKPQCRTKIDM